MAISIIYRVSHILPGALDAYLSRHDDVNHKFELAIMDAYSGHDGSGANNYSDREEWAEFTDQATAKRADDKARKVITAFHMQVIREGAQS